MRLKELRKARNLKQIEVADFLSCSQGVYSRYENSDREPPFDIIVKLADFYGVTVDYLMDVESPSQSQPKKPEKAETKEETPPANTGGEPEEYTIMARGGFSMDKYKRLSLEDKRVVDDMVNRLFELAFGKE